MNDERHLYDHTHREQKVSNLKTVSVRITPEEFNWILEKTKTDKISVALRTIIDEWTECREILNEAIEKVDELKETLSSRDMEIENLNKQLNSMKDEINNRKIVIYKIDSKTSEPSVTNSFSTTRKILSFIGIVFGIPSFIILILLFVFHL